MSDAALINKLRLELEKAAAIYSSPETHGLMERTLGDVWDMALMTYGDNKTKATEFLLAESFIFQGKSLFDVALSGEVGYQMAYDHIGRLQHGIYC